METQLNLVIMVHLIASTGFSLAGKEKDGDIIIIGLGGGHGGGGHSRRTKYIPIPIPMPMMPQKPKVYVKTVLMPMMMGGHGRRYGHRRGGYQIDAYSGGSGQYQIDGNSGHADGYTMNNADLYNTDNNGDTGQNIDYSYGNDGNDLINDYSDYWQ